jgi:predicted nuclease of restriction endonuclease-like (RecB) superfamily
MRAFAEAYPEESIVQKVVGQIPWGHNLKIIEMIKDPAQRGTSRKPLSTAGAAMCFLQIESGLYARQGEAVTNFDRTLPKPQSDLAQQLIKDPYNFDFLTISDDAHERELELIPSF